MGRKEKKQQEEQRGKQKCRWKRHKSEKQRFQKKVKRKYESYVESKDRIWVNFVVKMDHG